MAVAAGELDGGAIVETAGTLLTERQQEVLDLLATAASNKEIGRVLGISHLTVRFHLSAIMRILGVSRRQDAVAKARALGLLDP